MIETFSILHENKKVTFVNKTKMSKWFCVTKWEMKRKKDPKSNFLKLPKNWKREIFERKCDISFESQQQQGIDDSWQNPFSIRAPAETSWRQHCQKKRHKDITLNSISGKEFMLTFFPLNSRIFFPKKSFKIMPSDIESRKRLRKFFFSEWIFVYVWNFFLTL